ncbi:ATP-binding protein [Lewinella sp. LCG006]|uniref:sensor histidine kinase n=1 Tax=Lewinella sp. LCG006 TaxID=3231911 RepID=UPI003460D77C
MPDDQLQAGAEKDLLIAELQQQIKDLQQSNQDLEHFAYVASHDLQAPLRTVEGYLGIIRQELDKENISSDIEEYFQHVTFGVKRLQQLIKDLLEYSRAGRMVERQRVMTLPMLEIVKYNLRHNLEKTDATVTTSGLPEEFQGHRMGITQLFQNLLANAINFSKEDVPNHIHVEAKDQKDYWQFSITDQGIGIAPENHQKIFELFTRLVPREVDDKGTGIGLALCKRIVESHGGKIWVESELGQGSTFYFTIKK